MSRRRRRALLMALVAAGGLVAFSFNDRAGRRPAHRASASTLAAFLDRAARGLAAHRQATYRVVLALDGSQVDRQLSGPGIQRALVTGLDRAVAAAAPATPIVLQARNVLGRSVQCLQFGPRARPLGSACLTAAGVVAFDDVPTALTRSPYRVATLETGAESG